jgi:predicted transposase YbfD/YdcC
MKRRPNPGGEEMETASILEYFAAVADPRIARSRLHPLGSMLVMSLMAVIAGADSFVAIEEFGRAREAWLRKFLDLPNGIPSHDTLGRVFALLDPAELTAAFRAWMADVAADTRGDFVALDGKTLRRSFRKKGAGFVHMVSAWSSRNRMVLGQVKTEEKSNEITAIPRLLSLLKLKGCMVTIDAMGCQKEIAQQIVNAGADYVLAVKDNQPTLSHDAASVFLEQYEDRSVASSMDFCETEESNHGRHEVRRCWTTGRTDLVRNAAQWPGLQSLILVESDRTADGITALEQRFFISSKAGIKADEALRAVRSHWGIENSLHWVLDVAFREDDCRVRAGHAAENFSVMRQLALNMLKSVKNSKVGIKNRRLRAAWDETFLISVIAAFQAEL